MSTRYRRSVTYREHAPALALRHHVACYWTHFYAPHDNTNVVTTHRVLPDGCMDLLVRFDENRGATASIIGTMTTAIVTSSTSRTALVGIRFLPGEAFAFLDLSARFATDREVAPRDAGLGDTTPLLDALSTLPVSAWPSALDRFLCARLARVRPADVRVRRSVRALMDTRGNTRVSCLASELGVSERHLERAFLERVGVSPKSFARVIRLQSLIAMLNRETTPLRDRSWAFLAADFGYADQSHLVREVKALTGLTPGNLLRERMSDLFNPITDLSDTFPANSPGELK
jgi:AraC-like DNA-binding protein